MPIQSKFDNYDKNFMFQCKYLDLCSGCHKFDIPYQEQLNLKKQNFLSLLLSAQILSKGSEMSLDAVSAGPEALRDRLDFSWQNQKLGLYKRDSREILDIDHCPQLSPALQEFYQEFRKISWPMEKASFRLRVSPSGQRGLWIDCANIDIKRLLDERLLLEGLLEKMLIEMGQRRKFLKRTPQGLKLEEPRQHHWFSTWAGDQELPLFCQIASFTQPSHKANRRITHIICEWLGELTLPRIIEFGSGIGNLTLPAAQKAKNLLACEIDKLALASLEQSLIALPENRKELRERIQIFRGDFQRKIQTDFDDFDLILANPPRSGLMNFLNPLESMEPHRRPPYFLYMSCFPESMVKDLQRLKACGYSLKKSCLVDQFPQTEHYEVLSLLKRE